jgi:hypothetical protein
MILEIVLVMAVLCHGTGIKKECLGIVMDQGTCATLQELAKQSSTDTTWNIICVTKEELEK